MDANTVGAVAALTGVSVRTLHHYDHIGLVVPSVRTPAGYRGYTDADIERLHFVLVYRSVGMPLEEIRALLDDSSADVLEHLQHQHDVLLEQAERLQQTIKALEELMDAHREGIQLTAEEQVEIFGTTVFSEEYAVEAEERWGQTDAWKQSQQRVSTFSKQDWIAIKAEGDALLEALAQAKRRGVEPGSDEANLHAADTLAGQGRAQGPGPSLRLVEEPLLDQLRALFGGDLDVARREHEHAVGDALHAAVQGVGQAAGEVDQALGQIGVGALQVQDDRDVVLELVGDLLGVVERLGDDEVHPHAAVAPAGRRAAPADGPEVRPGGRLVVGEDVVELVAAAARAQPADVRPVGVGALQLLVGEVAVLVPIVFLGDPEIDEGLVPDVCEAHAAESYCGRRLPNNDEPTRM